MCVCVCFDKNILFTYSLICVGNLLLLFSCFSICLCCNMFCLFVSGQLHVLTQTKFHHSNSNKHSI